MSGPDTSATRSRFPDHPETVKVPVVHPIEMTMLRKLITTGETWCTTCSSNGRNKVTEVCVIPCNAALLSGIFQASRVFTRQSEFAGLAAAKRAVWEAVFCFERG